MIQEYVTGPFRARAGMTNWSELGGVGLGLWGDPGAGLGSKGSAAHDAVRLQVSVSAGASSASQRVLGTTMPSCATQVTTLVWVDSGWPHSEGHGKNVAGAVIHRNENCRQSITAFRWLTAAL